MFRIALLTAIFSLTGVVTRIAVSAPAGVVEWETDAAIYFRTQNERSLYFNESEFSRGEVTCLEACLDTWTPFEATSARSSDGRWSVISRPDNSLQWAYGGKPLYTYAGDTYPGARTGDGAGRGVWKLLKTFKSIPALMRIEATPLGYVLADDAGHTLYTGERGVADDDAGVGTVANPWEIFDAPWLAVDQGRWTIETRAGGTRQWSYDGRRLYTFKKDRDPGDVQGHDPEAGWSAVILEKAPGLPSWVTVEWTDAGLIYADENKMTLYAPIDVEVIRAAQTCPEDCMRENWRPVLADSGEKSVGNWIVRENADGQRQWSYKGRLAYVHTRDKVPGDMRGHGIAVGYRIGQGWRVIPVE